MELFVKYLLGISVKPKPQYCLPYPLNKVCFANEAEAQEWLYFIGFLGIVPLALCLHFLMRRLKAVELKAQTSKRIESPTGTSAAPDVLPEDHSVLQTLHILERILAQRRDLETKLKILQNSNNSTCKRVRHRIEQKDHRSHSILWQ